MRNIHLSIIDTPFKRKELSDSLFRALYESDISQDTTSWEHALDTACNISVDSRFSEDGGVEGIPGKDSLFWSNELRKYVCCISSEALEEYYVDQMVKEWENSGFNKKDLILANANYLLDHSNHVYYNSIMEEFKYIMRNCWKYANISFNKIKVKKYVCLNHSEKQHRSSIVSFLQDSRFGNNLIDLGYVSYVDKNLILDYDDNPTNDLNWRWDVLNKDIIEKSFFSIITETWFDNKTLFITEKVLKGLISHPFILVSTNGMLNRLHEMGFKTHPHFFDESYDDIDKPQNRMSFIKNEIITVCSYSNDKLNDLYNESISIIKHNREVAKSLPYSELNSIMGFDVVGVGVGGIGGWNSVSLDKLRKL